MFVENQQNQQTGFKQPLFPYSQNYRTLKFLFTPSACLLAVAKSRKLVTNFAHALTENISVVWSHCSSPTLWLMGTNGSYFPPTFPHAYWLTLNCSQIYFSHDSSQPNPNGPWISESKDNNMHNFVSVFALLIQKNKNKAKLC